MGLVAGTKLGPYEILASLGAGGMGEVYRAFDPRLGREVAIKILPDLFASDPDRLRRFELEARSVGALNHPNILAVHDLGVQAGTHYIVTEFLQGETLRQKIESGPLMPRRASEYAVQIARGLAAAHEKGIVHRDLKPENLFITSDGRIKILDFGLAKPVSVVEAGAEAPTVASDQTTGGVVLGTVGYMAPEQVRGEAVDARTDIFAFGAVLYEMLSGQRAFQRHSSVETMAAILKEDPPDLPASEERKTPPALDRIFRRCLEKSPSQRFQSSKDLSFALENVDPVSTRQQAILPIPPTQNRWRPVSFALALVAVAAALVAGWEFLTRPQQPTYQQLTFRNGTIASARFGVNGETVVYAATWDSPRTKLYSSRLNETEVRALDLPPSDLLAVARSGELAIAEVATTGRGPGGRLARVPTGGAGPRDLLEHVVAADWSPDSTELAVARVENGTCRLEYPIGKVRYQTIGWISDMRVSPQGDAIALHGASAPCG